MDYKNSPKARARLSTLTSNEQYDHYYYKKGETKPMKIEEISIEQQKNLQIALEMIDGEIKDVQSSIDFLIKLMDDNFYGVFFSCQFQNGKTKFANALCRLLSRPETISYSLGLIFNFIIESNDLDEIFLNQVNQETIINIFRNLQTNELIINYLDIIIIFISRNIQFIHQLFQRNFYDLLPLCFNKNPENDYSIENEEEIKHKISSLILKTSENAKYLRPNENIALIQLLDMLLTVDNTEIVRCGLAILSNISREIVDAYSVLENGRILENVCRLLCNYDPEYLCEVVSYLVSFATFGEKVIRMLSRNKCLQKLSELLDLQNHKLMSQIFDLLANWLIYASNSSFGLLDDSFDFIKTIDFQFLFNYSEFDLKCKSMKILRLFSSHFTMSQVFEVLTPGLLMVLVSQIEVCDDPTLCYEGCFLIQTILSKTVCPQYMGEIQIILRRNDFFNRLNELKEEQFGESYDTARYARDIISFIKDARFSDEFV